MLFLTLNSEERKLACHEVRRELFSSPWGTFTFLIIFRALTLELDSRSSFIWSICWIKCHNLLFSFTPLITPFIACPSVPPPALTLPRWRNHWGGTERTSQLRPASQPACPRQVQPAACTATCLESSVWVPTPLAWRIVWCQDGGEIKRGCTKLP